MVPILLTERLQLDAHRADDLDALAAMWAQREVYRSIGDGNPRPREEVWLRLLRHAGQWALLGWGTWVARMRRDDAATGLSAGALVGEVGLIDAARAAEPVLDAPEAGWVIRREAQGRGLAREAVDAALAWADSANMAETCCIIDPDNAASIRLAARVGFRVAGAVRYRERDVALFRRALGAGGRGA